MNKRKQLNEIMRNNLENLGVKTVNNNLALHFKRGKIVDGKQNIDKFVKSILKIKNEKD